MATPTTSALAQARRRIGPAPLRALFDMLRGPAAGPATKGVYWRGRLVTAIDGTMMCCPDTTANPRVYRRGGGHHGGTGYPMIRMPTLVACGTRTIIDATFGSTSIGETSYTRNLLRALHRGMIVPADRNFAVASDTSRNTSVRDGLERSIRPRSRYRPRCWWRRWGTAHCFSRAGAMEQAPTSYPKTPARCATLWPPHFGNAGRCNTTDQPQS